MFKSCLASFFAVAVMLALGVPSAVAQSTDRTMPMRTVDGQPHVSGVFTFRTLTPLQRPTQFEGQENLTAEEAAGFPSFEEAKRLPAGRRPGAPVESGRAAA